MSRGLITRIQKLEARRHNNDEMLLVWRKLGSDNDSAVLAAKKAGLFGSGDG
jgi:hypothetical protein